MRKKLLSKVMLLLAMLVMGASSVWAAEEVFYTLTPAGGSNNSYAGNLSANYGFYVRGNDDGIFGFVGVTADLYKPTHTVLVSSSEDSYKNVEIEETMD